MSEPLTICWKCARCDWVGCYTAADLEEYGEPSECQDEYHEGLYEIGVVEGLEALSDRAATEVRAAKRALANAAARSADLERQLVEARTLTKFTPTKGPAA